MKKYYFLSLLLLVIGIILGLTTSHSNFSNFGFLKNDISNTLNKESILKIFINNLSLITILHFGFLSFGLIIIPTLIYNGFIISYILNKAFHYLNFLDIFNSTFPHSIEIVAILYSAGYGLKQSIILIKWLKNDNLPFQDLILRYTKNYFISVVIVFCAAFLEVTISIK